LDKKREIALEEKSLAKPNIVDVKDTIDALVNRNGGKPRLEMWNYKDRGDGLTYSFVKATITWKWLDGSTQTH